MKTYVIEFYQSETPTNRWRWRVKGNNGEIIGASSEGFTTKQNAKRNLELLRESIEVSAENGTLNEAYLNPLN